MGHGREWSVFVGRKNFLSVECCPMQWGCLYYLPWAIDTLKLKWSQVVVSSLWIEAPLAQRQMRTWRLESLWKGDDIKDLHFLELGAQGWCVLYMESNRLVEFAYFHSAHPKAVTLNVKTNHLRKRVWTSRRTSRYSKIHLHFQSFTLSQSLWRSSSSKQPNNPKTTT